MKKYIFPVVFVFIFFVVGFIGCSGKESKETIELRKALYYGLYTIDTSMNSIADKEGTISYYMPKEQPTNQTFRCLGVKIEKDGIMADYIIMVDTSANIAKADTLIFGEKYKFEFNGKGRGLVDGWDEYDAFLTWAGGKAIANIATMTEYQFSKPEFSILDRK